ncbi:MAG: hypothetical protein BWY26_00904 [Elusimicrobia bacterium ADurb.Bin231]|nr:MAG: hypothetical protein BWY26_00904 [Elusimicrobia bacterium ADurb.Bin231]
MKLEKTIIKSWKEFLLIFTLVFFYSCRPFSDTPFKHKSKKSDEESIVGSISSDTPSEHKSKKYETLPVMTIEDAEKYAIGVWTYSDPTPLPGDPMPLPYAYASNVYFDLRRDLMCISDSTWFFFAFYAWHRYNFKAGGVGEYQYAVPSDDDWGAIKKIKWKINARKYRNTGKRYFEIAVSHNSEHTVLVLTSSCDIFYYHPDDYGFEQQPKYMRAMHFTKDAVFPFSK